MLKVTRSQTDKPRGTAPVRLPLPIIIAGVFTLLLGTACCGLLLHLQHIQEQMRSQLVNLGVSPLVAPATATATETPQPTEYNADRPIPPDDVRLALLAHNDPMTIGDPEAPLVVTKFSDFECPFCVAFFRDIYTPMHSEYVDTGKVLIRRRAMPLYYHNYARPAEEAALCAGIQGKYWEMHNLLYTYTNVWTNEQFMNHFIEFGDRLELNQKPFQDCMTSHRFTEKIDQDIADGIELGLQGIPTIYIGTEAYTNIKSYDEFKKILDEKLAERMEDGE